jgi:hypothetical protein
MNMTLRNLAPDFRLSIKADFSSVEACFVATPLTQRYGVKTPYCAVSPLGIFLPQRVIYIINPEVIYE